MEKICNCFPTAVKISPASQHRRLAQKHQVLCGWAQHRFLLTSGPFPWCKAGIITLWNQIQILSILFITVLPLFSYPAALTNYFHWQQIGTAIRGEWGNIFLEIEKVNSGYISMQAKIMLNNSYAMLQL